jgi:hypothetical protein
MPHAIGTYGNSARSKGFLPRTVSVLRVHPDAPDPVGHIHPDVVSVAAESNDLIAPKTGPTESVMSKAIGLGVIAVAVLGTSMTWTSVRADTDPYAANGTAAQVSSTTTSEGPAPWSALDPWATEDPGAASPEPPQVMEDSAANADQAWVDSIHSSP